jgi:TPR repeat protein
MGMICWVKFKLNAASQLLLPLYTLCILVALFAGSAHSADLQLGIDAHENGDYATALREWKPLAEQGDVEAQNNMGVSYSKGHGVVKDHEIAFKWYYLAAQQDYAIAQNSLAVKYVEGLGVPKNYTIAHMWWNIAASQGNANGERNRDKVENRMTAAQIEDAKALAKDWMEKHRKRRNFMRLCLPLWFSCRCY